VGDDVEPAVTGDIGEDDVAIIGWGQKTLITGHIGGGGELGGAVDEDAVLVHEQNVGSRTVSGPAGLADDDQVDVSILIEISPGVVLL